MYELQVRVFNYVR